MAAKVNNVKLKKNKEKFDYLFVQEVFEVTKKTEPTSAELTQWMNALKQGASREGLYRSLVLSDEYRELERFENPATDKSIQFTLDFLKKFLAFEVDPGSFKKLNNYSLKRLVVEKSLDVIDALAPDSEKLSDWYAVFSSELAQIFPDIWKGKIRGLASKKAHKNWALSVPLQHLKSEVIIKLHKVFNSLI